MDKPQEEQEVEKKIAQYQNRQKILLNKKRSEEHRARTHRLIGRGAILEGVFPAVMEMEGKEVKAFLIALSRLPGRLIPVPRSIYARYALEKKFREIAADEGISGSCACDSVTGALKKLQRIFAKNGWLEKED